MGAVGRLFQATYIWISNTTLGNESGDSCIDVLSPDNSQSPDGTIAPKYHSTPIDDVSLGCFKLTFTSPIFTEVSLKLWIGIKNNVVNFFFQNFNFLRPYTPLPF